MRSPLFNPEIAIPNSVLTWMAQFTSARPARTPLCSVKPGRLTPADSKEMRLIAERRRLLEWRASSANISDTPLLPWLGNARARSRLAKMRAMPREEDVCIALLKEHGMPLDPPEERR